MTAETTKLPDQLKFTGRILFLTEDTSLIRQQLEAAGDEQERLEAELTQRLINDELPLMSNISTDGSRLVGFAFITMKRSVNTFTLRMREAPSRKTKSKTEASRSSFRACRKVVALLAKQRPLQRRLPEFNS